MKTFDGREVSVEEWMSYVDRKSSEVRRRKTKKYTPLVRWLEEQRSFQLIQITTEFVRRGKSTKKQRCRALQEIAFLDNRGMLEGDLAETMTKRIMSGMSTAEIKQLIAEVEAELEKM